nr:MAG TPA: Integrase [Caudoviricetes sp.]
MKKVKVPEAEKLPSGSYRCRVMVNGKSKSFTADTKRDAEQAALEYKISAEQEQKEICSCGLPLTKAIDEYISAKDAILSPATIRGYRVVQKNRFQSLMQTRLNNISFMNLQKAVNEEAKTCSPKTIRNAVGLLYAVLKFHGIDMQSVALPQKIDKEKQIYTEDELRKLFDTVRGTDLEIVVLLACWLGMRRSEIIGLKWEDVDLKKKSLLVASALVLDENNKYVEKGTKTEKSRRRFTLPDYIVDLLSNAPHDGPRVVMTSPQTIRNRLVAATERAGIPFYGLHALRHMNASIMLSLNTPDKYAMERGGWSSDKTMKKIYQHTMTAEREKVDASIDAYFDAIVQKQTPRRWHIKKSNFATILSRSQKA